jgi:hypothetical protein
MIIEAPTKTDCLRLLDHQIEMGQYRLDERDLAELRAVRRYLAALNVLDRSVN